MPSLRLVHSVERQMSHKQAAERLAAKRDRLENLRRWEEHKRDLIHNHGYSKCDNCGGIGYDGDDACRVCDGAGAVLKAKR